MIVSQISGYPDAGASLLKMTRLISESGVGSEDDGDVASPTLTRDFRWRDGRMRFSGYVLWLV